VAHLEANRVALIRYRSPDGMTRVGSGVLVDERNVLTADHVADGTGHSIECHGEFRNAAAILRSGDAAVDLAVLTASEPLGTLGRLRFARIDRGRADRVQDCVAVGFPRWRSMQGQRRSAQVDGYIPTAEGLESTADLGLRAGLLTLVGNRDPAMPDIPNGGLRDVQSNPWGGMSGAGVIASGLVVGVVRSHNLAAGGHSLTVTQVTAVDELPDWLRNRFWDALGVTAPDQLESLPGGGAIALLAGLQQDLVEIDRLIDAIQGGVDLNRGYSFPLPYCAELLESVSDVPMAGILAEQGAETIAGGVLAEFLRAVESAYDQASTFVRQTDRIVIRPKAFDRQTNATFQVLILSLILAAGYKALQDAVRRDSWRQRALKNRADFLTLAIGERPSSTEVVYSAFPHFTETDKPKRYDQSIGRINTAYATVSNHLSKSG
jgi:hypothetical protein